MYGYRCKDCENLEHCMHMMNMPMENMPMMNMPMMNMPMMNMPMENMPMMNMPMMKEDDGDLTKMYPKMYIRIYPMVRAHCDMMESMHGAMYCPSMEEMDHICKQVCDKYEKHHEDKDDVYDCKDDDMRQRRRQGRRGPLQDLIRILFIRDLLGRRRRRRRPHYGY